MFFRTKAIPLQARNALGFRGSKTERSCFYCGTTEENNFNKEGKLTQLRIKSLDKNLNNTRVSNHIYVCGKCQ